MEVLVSFEGAYKIVKLGDAPLDFNNIIRQRFGFSSDEPFSVKVFSKKFNRFVDVDDGTEVFDGAELQIKRLSPTDVMTTPTFSMASCSTVPEASAYSTVDGGDLFSMLDSPTEGSRPEGKAVPEEGNGAPSSRDASMPEEPADDPLAPDVKEDPNNSVDADSKRAQALQRLPFALESLSLNLRRKLESETELAQCDWRELTSAIFLGFTGKANSYYPGKCGYDALASDLKDAFPFLCGSLRGLDARSFIKNKISTKFSNKRRYAADSEVAAQKKKKVSTPNEGLPAYMPATPKDTLEERKLGNLLLQETDPERKKELLKATFPYRRNYLKEIRHSMSRYMERYPAALTADAMWTDFTLMSGETAADPADLKEAARERLKRILQKFKDATHSELNDEDLLRDLLEELDGADLRLQCGSAPYLQRRAGDVNILSVEGVVIEASTCYIDAALLWALSFPVLQQKLPGARGNGKGLRSAASFLYRYALNINGGPQLANRLLKKLAPLL